MSDLQDLFSFSFVESLIGYPGQPCIATNDILWLS